MQRPLGSRVRLTLFSNEKRTLSPMTFTRAHAHTAWKTHSVTYGIHTCTCAYSLENLLCYLRHPHKHTHIEHESLQGITEKRWTGCSSFSLRCLKSGLPSNQEVSECEENVTSRFLTFKNISLIWYHTCNVSKEAGPYSHKFSGLMFVNWSYEELVEGKISIQGKKW